MQPKILTYTKAFMDSEPCKCVNLGQSCNMKSFNEHKHLSIKYQQVLHTLQYQNILIFLVMSK